MRPLIGHDHHKKSQTYSNLQTGFDEIHWPNGILDWHCHHMPKAGQLLVQEELGARENRQVLFLAKTECIDLSSLKRRGLSLRFQPQAQSRY